MLRLPYDIELFLRTSDQLDLSTIIKRIIGNRFSEIPKRHVLLRKIGDKQDDMEKAAKRLTKLRTEAGLNQNQFAKAVGVTRACVSRWEKGDISTMVVRNAIKVCEVLDTDLNYLFYGRVKSAPLDLDSLQKAIKMVEEVSDGWASKSKASVAAIIYKMLSEGEIRSNLTFDQLKKIQRQKKVA